MVRVYPKGGQNLRFFGAVRVYTWGVRPSFLSFASMKIPFANRTVDITLPQSPTSSKVTIKEVIDDFYKQLPDKFSPLMEAFVLMSPRLVRVTCKTARAAEELNHSGLTFRGSPITICPCVHGKWIHLTRLSYGVPQESITEALKPFGTVISVKMDTYRNVYLGVRNVLVDIRSPIPSRLQVAGHWCNVFYSGQPKTCFYCNMSGHDIKQCPKKPPSRGSAAPEPLVTEVRVAASAAPAPCPSCQALGHLVDQCPNTSRAPSAVGSTELTPSNPGDATTCRDTGSPIGVAQPDPASAVGIPVCADAGSPVKVPSSSEGEGFMDATEHSNKRDRSDDESSDHPGPSEKKGKPASSPLFSFDLLTDEAAQLPLPPDSSDCESVTMEGQMGPPSSRIRSKRRSKPKPSSSSGLSLPPGATAMAPASTHDEGRCVAAPPEKDAPVVSGAISDVIAPLPSQPEVVTVGTAADNPPLDNPSSQCTSTPPGPGSRPDSCDPLTLALRSKKTLPAPVYGTKKKSFSQ